MENNTDHLLEIDAAPIVVQSSEIVEHSNQSGGLDTTKNINRSVMLTNQTNTAVFKFDNCKGINLGSVFNVGWSPGNIGHVAPPNISNESRRTESVYKKTPTIKMMLESSDLISAAFLDIVSGNLGSRWKELPILLQINKLFVERMFEDFHDRGGTKEVVFQILSKYFKDHEEKSTVGWLVSFLWTNGFRETVWTTKESWKKLKELERDLEG